MKPLGTTRQSGAALILMVVILVLGASWFLVTAVNAPHDRTALDRAHNAKVLEEAKRALIGYVANEAAKTTEPNPGHIPCPESHGNIGTANEGIKAASCNIDFFGRLPWRTLGIDQLRDAAGEPLWLVVAPGWRRSNAATPNMINSNCDDPASPELCSTGRFTVDGVARTAVALIIAPGKPFQVKADAIDPSCSGFSQTRAGTPVPAPRNYLECQNGAAGASYVTTGPSESFNDQVLVITAADILPAIEAAVAQRFERQIAPPLRAVYTNGEPGFANASWPATNTVLPFAAPLANIGSLKGTASSFQGLLPLNRVRTRCTPVPPATDCTPAACTPGAGCDSSSAFVAWTGAATLVGTGADAIYSPSCTVTPTQIDCTFYVRMPILGALLGAPPANVDFTLTAAAQNVGMGLRQLQTTVPMPGVNTAGRSVTGSLAATGAANITLNGRADTSDLAGLTVLGLVNGLLCGVSGILGLTVGCAQETLSVPISMFVDHPLTDENDATYGWFMRNRWHEVAYYAAAPAVAPGGTGACTSGADCLTVNYRSPSDTYRSVLVFAGRPLTMTVPAQVRPPVAVSDLLEGGNALVGNATPLAPFTTRDPALTVNRTFTDRIAVIGAN